MMKKIKRIGLTILVIAISGFCEAIGAIAGILSGAMMFDWAIVNGIESARAIGTISLIVMTTLVTICVIVGSRIILEQFGLTKKDGATA